MTVVCIATGPSLVHEDVDACRGQFVVTVNDAYRLAPWADAMYACDQKWWNWQHVYHPQALEAFDGARYSLQPTRVDGVWSFKNAGTTGLSLDKDALKTGRNSGYQAINLAVHLGALRIVLLGFDMSLGRGGKAHYFGDHPDGRQPPLCMFRRHFRTIVEPLKKAGVEVLNCSRRSALTMFPKVPLAHALMRRAA